MKSKYVSIIIFLAMLLLSCTRDKIEKYEDSRFLFGTYIKIIIYDKDMKLCQVVRGTPLEDAATCISHRNEATFLPSSAKAVLLANPTLRGLWSHLRQPGGRCQRQNRAA